jgi:predicted Zn-dependent protease
MKTNTRTPLVVAMTLLVTAVLWAADNRTVLKPGWNMFSPKQDVEVGQEVSKDAERQLPMLKNSRLDNYVNTLGRRLAAKAPGEKYPYEFQVVNDSAINAFALPGGPIYINRGVIEAADNEAQLAGVIAHEISHVAMRHGTNQASKASAAQLPLSILGGLIGSDSTKAALAQLGASFAVNSILLKYSRTAETQADVMGTQILYDAGYDPRAMAQFFQKIEADQEGGGAVEFFSNHPSPDNRIERVNEEVSLLGGRDVTRSPVPASSTTRRATSSPWRVRRGASCRPAGPARSPSTADFASSPPATAPANGTSTCGIACSPV